MFRAIDSIREAGVSALTLYASPVKMRSCVAGVDGAVNGASYGPAATAGIASIAEYVERLHLKYGVPVHARERLGNLYSRISSLEPAVTQLHGICPPPDELTIACTQAFRYADWSLTLAPRSLVSLGRGDVVGDFRLNPYVDSSGTAAHISADAAVGSALLEFIERQVWTAFWLGGGIASEVDVDLKADSLGAACIRDAPGTFSFYHLCAGLPGYTVLGLYQGKSRLNEPRFACGLATALSPGKAFRKALLELAHYRQFICSKFAMLHERPMAVGRLERNSLGFQIANPLDFMIDRSLSHIIVSGEEFLRLEPHTQEDLKRALLEVSTEVFVYLGRDSSVLGDFFISRFFSPDFYLHCDPGVDLNLSNAYAKSLGISNPDARLRTSTCLP